MQISLSTMHDSNMNEAESDSTEKYPIGLFIK